jgi:hypothetical protein
VIVEEVVMNSDSDADEKQKLGVVDISTLDLYRLLQFFASILSEKAWRYMGLRVDPLSGEIEKDLERAHAAIDCIIFLVEKMESHLTVEESDRLRNLITDLQINYARQVEEKSK